MVGELVDRVDKCVKSSVSYKNFEQILDDVEPYKISKDEFNKVIKFVDERVVEKDILDCLLEFADWYHGNSRNSWKGVYDDWRNLKENVDDISSKVGLYLSML